MGKSGQLFKLIPQTLVWGISRALGIGHARIGKSDFSHAPCPVSGQAAVPPVPATERARIAVFL